MASKLINAAFFSLIILSANYAAAHRSVCGDGKILDDENYKPEETDANFIFQAVNLAESALGHKNHPFGAVLVHHGKVIAEAMNEVNNIVGEQNSRPDVTRHAEMQLIRKAQADPNITPEMIKNSKVYTSAEPCTMCASAIAWAGVGTVVYSEGQDTFGNNSQGRSIREVYKTGKKLKTVIGPVHDRFHRHPASDYFKKEQ